MIVWKSKADSQNKDAKALGRLQPENFGLGFCKSASLRWLLSMLIAFQMPLATQGSVPPNFYSDPDLTRLALTAPLGTVITFTLGGYSYSAKIVSRVPATRPGGLPNITIDDVKVIGRSEGPSVTPGDRASANQAPQPQAPSGGSSALGGSFASGLGAGALAGLQALGIGGAYNLLIMTPDREAASANTRRELVEAGQSLASAQRSLNRAIDSQLTALERGFLGGQATVASASTVATDLIGLMRQTSVAPGVSTPDFSRLDDVGFQTRARDAWDALGRAPTRSQVGAVANDIGKAAVFAAVDARSAGEIEVSESALKVAETMADIGVGLDPYTGFVRDSFELFSGKNMITGDELSNWERGLAGVGFAGSLMTFGLASSAVHGLKAMTRILNRTHPGQVIRNLRIAEESRRAIEAMALVGATRGSELVDFTERSFRTSLSALGDSAKFTEYLERGAQRALEAPPEVVAQFYRGTSGTEQRALAYHLGKHGGDRTAAEYLGDAQRFFAQNRSSMRATRLSDGTPGLHLNTRSFDPAGMRVREGGYFTPDGRVVTFWSGGP